MMNGSYLSCSFTHVILLGGLIMHLGGLSVQSESVLLGFE